MNPSSPSSRQGFSESNDPAGSAFVWAQRAGAVGEVLAELTVLKRRRRAVFKSVAVVALVMTLGVVWYQPSITITRQAQPRSMTTWVVAKPSQLILPDGSVVELKNDAELIPVFSSDSRAVTLLKGTAYFQVKKDPARPFIVTAGGVAVRAVGTAFNVELVANSVGVLVTEGRVAVSQETSAGAMMVSKGEEVSVGAEEKGNPPLAVAVQAVPVEVIAERLSWRIPRFEFTGTSLDEVAAMFNRHNQHQLILNDPALGHLRLSGILRADNLPALVKMLETQFHVAVEYRGANEIVLRTRP